MEIRREEKKIRQDKTRKRDRAEAGTEPWLETEA
jgi:hypothetical protein